MNKKIVTAIAKETPDSHVKIYLALLRSMKHIISKEQRKTYVFDFSFSQYPSPIEEAMQKKLVELLHTYRELIYVSKKKVIDPETPKPLLDWCLDLDIEDIWEIIGTYEAFYIWQNNKGFSLEEIIKDDIVDKIEEVIWNNVQHGDTWKKIAEIFAFMYESYRKGDAFSLKARLRLSFLEANLRVTFGQDISLFGQGTEHRKILEDVLDKQDLLSQGDQKNVLEMITNFAMKVPWKQWKQVLDIIEHRINLDWITSQDRDRYTKMWEEKKYLPTVSFVGVLAKSVFDQFDSWSAWESFLSKSS